MALVVLVGAVVNAPQANTSAAGSCTFRLAIGPKWSEATGQETVTFILRNVATTSCTVNGYPRVALRTATVKRLAFAYRHGGDQMLTHRSPRTVVVRGGGAVFFAINKFRCDAYTTTVVRLADVGLPGGPSMLRARLPQYPVLSYCPGDVPGEGVDVSPFVASLRELSAHP